MSNAEWMRPTKRIRRDYGAWRKTEIEEQAEMRGIGKGNGKSYLSNPKLLEACKKYDERKAAAMRSAETTAALSLAPEGSTLTQTPISAPLPVPGLKKRAAKRERESYTVGEMPAEAPTPQVYLEVDPRRVDSEERESDSEEEHARCQLKRVVVPPVLPDPDTNRVPDTDTDTTMAAPAAVPHVDVDEESEGSADEGETGGEATALGMKAATLKRYMSEYPWLVVGGGEARCKICNQTFLNKARFKDQVSGHADRKKHKVAQEKIGVEVLKSLRDNPAQRKVNSFARAQFCKLIQTIYFLARSGVAYTDNTSSFLTFFSSILSDADMQDYLTHDTNYISHTGIADILRCLREVFMEDISAEAKASPYFGISADCSKDVSRVQQLVVVLRYLVNAKVKEQLVHIGELKDTTGTGYADKIEKVLEDLGVDKTRLAGVAFDGAAAMRSELRGAQQQIRTRCNANALFVWCCAHSLNLSCLDSKEGNILKVFTVLNWLWVYFSASASREDVLDDLLSVPGMKETEQENRKKLVRPGETRWLSTGRATQVVVSQYKAICAALTKISATDIEGTSILNAIVFPEFYAGLLLVHDVLQELNVLSTTLQSRSTSVFNVCTSIDVAISNIATIDTHPALSPTYSTWIASFANQTNRYLHESNFEKFHSETSHPYLKNLSTSLTDRFANVNTVRLFSIFDGTRLREEGYGDKQIKQLVELFADYKQLSYRKYAITGELCPSRPVYHKTEFSTVTKVGVPLLQIDINHFTAEQKEALGELGCRQASALREWVGMRRVFCQLQGDITEGDVQYFLNTEHGDSYPTIKQLFQLGQCLPVTSVEDERLFSLLKRIKTDLRNRLSDENLFAIMLCSLSDHGDILPEGILERVITKFNAIRPRTLFIKAVAA